MTEVVVEDDADLPASAATILVADDEPDIVDLVASRLRRSGFAVITAANGAEALHAAQDQEPDLALLDVMMPKLSGVEVARLLRAAPETHRIPVVLMSASSVDSLVVPGEADAFIAKPFVLSALPALVHEVLARRARGAATRTG